MKFKLPALVFTRAALLGLLVFWPRSSQGQGPCPPAGVIALERGWRAYRSDSLSVALAQFHFARGLCPENLDASVGLGFSLLRLGKLGPADSVFRVVLARSPRNPDAWEGRTRAALRLGDTVAAIDAGRQAMSLNRGNAELRGVLEKISPDWDRPLKPQPIRPADLQLVARTRGQGFEVRTSGAWESFYVRGVNLGVALPGRYPSEFPQDSARYAGWLDTLAAMNANTVRVYTILPPSFYRALRGWNEGHPDKALWLLHGVWTELPPRHDFENPAWKGEFQAEMRRVVDVIHGAATIPAVPGHASGRYDADVSRWTLGYIIGREWEPYAVKAFDGGRRRGSYQGRFLEIQSGPATDLWMAQQCDFMLSYEARVYNALRPIAYTNWPTLDPLSHQTEANTREEAVWRRKSGRRADSNRLEYENDAIALDANLIKPTAANLAGWFASYHAYPYYPDFIMLDPSYRKARSAGGASSYFGYVQDLVRHHTSLPTVIAEYGVPSSRGIAHLHPQGWAHGGHDEQGMAAIDSRLTREIREAGAAGGIVFAWLDEWFKKNWLVIEYEIPLDNTRRWHNAMDAEQHYGILGMYAGDSATRPRLGGNIRNWQRLQALQVAADSASQGPRRIRIGSDESYVYLVVELPRNRFAWDSFGVQLALDTYLPEVGQHRLPRSGVRSELGFEFLIELVAPDSGTIAVLPEYNRHDARLDPVSGDDHGRFSRRPVITKNREDGRFDSLLVISNRARFARAGTFFPAQRYDRGRLAHGTEARSTLSDWYLDEGSGLLQLRIPWDLINVTDPSSRTLLFDRRTSGPFGTAAAQDFHVGALVYRKGALPKVLAALPEVEQGVWRAGSFRGWRWAGWTEPRYHSRLKPVFDSLRSLWVAPLSRARARPSRPAPSN